MSAYRNRCWSHRTNAKAPVFAHKWSPHCHPRRLKGDSGRMETPEQDVAGFVAPTTLHGFVSTFLVLSGGTRTMHDQSLPACVLDRLVPSLREFHQGQMPVDLMNPEQHQGWMSYQSPSDPLYEQIIRYRNYGRFIRSDDHAGRFDDP